MRKNGSSHRIVGWNCNIDVDSSVIPLLQNDRIKTAMHTARSILEMLGVLAIIGVLSIADLRANQSSISGVGGAYQNCDCSSSANPANGSSCSCP
ncbi:MAG: hypothetical protein ACI4RJ_04660 [Alphaproteobacteria bacterium]